MRVWLHRGFRAVSPCLAVAVLLAALGSSHAEEPPTGDDAAAIRKQRIAELERMQQEGIAHYRAGRFAEAIEIVVKMLPIEREVYGPDHEECVGSLTILSMLEEARGGWDAAAKHLEAVVAIRVRQHGSAHWKVTDVRLKVEDLRFREKLSPQQRMELKQADGLDGQARSLRAGERFAEALRCSERSLEIRKRLVGEEHWTVATVLERIARIHELSGDFVRAEPIYRRATAIYRERLGTNHLRCGSSINLLAMILNANGKCAEAEAFSREAITAIEIAEGEDGRYHGAAVTNLALIDSTMGVYAKAEEVYRRAIELTRKAYGEDHGAYAAVLEGLSQVDMMTGR